MVLILDSSLFGSSLALLVFQHTGHVVFVVPNKTFGEGECSS